MSTPTQSMTVNRRNPCTSSWIDQRPSSLTPNGVIFAEKKRKNKLKMKELGIGALESSISNPYVLQDEVVYDVKYFDDNEIYICCHDELIDDYPTTISKLINSAKYNKTKELSEWIENQKMVIYHKYGVGDAMWINIPTEDTKNDRVVVVDAILNEGKYCYDWMQDFIPKYIVKHIDHKNAQLESNETYTISAKLTNNKQIKNGGAGICSASDLTLICKQTGSVQYDYLIIQIYIRDMIINKYKNHCKLIGNLEIEKIANKLSSYLSPKNRQQKKFDFIDMNSTIFFNEFNALIKMKWSGTKKKQTLSISYNKSLLLFKNRNIVRTFKPKYGVHFILSITELKMTYYSKNGRMKVECFVQYV